MKVYQLAIALIALVLLREGAGDVLMLITGLAALANLGGLAIASFFAGWLAGAISELGPSYGQLKGLAAVGVIASIAIGVMKGVSCLPLAVPLMLLFYIPLSYLFLLLGARVAEVGIDVPPRHQEDNLGSGRQASDISAENSTAFPARPSQDRTG
jgi:hypothetical protein